MILYIGFEEQMKIEEKGEVHCRRCNGTVAFIDGPHVWGYCAPCNDVVEAEDRAKHEAIRNHGEAFNAAQKALVSAINAASTHAQIVEREACASLADDMTAFDIALKIRKRGAK